MAKVKYSSWRALLRMLRQNFPIERPIVVKRIKKKKDNGTLSFYNNKFYIYIDTTQSAEGQIDSILHEWAHARAIEEACEHAGTWGEHYGHIYQTWEKWDDS